ncbi:MAG: SDR family oxidoreductase [Coxiellaceae bacterium]|nr:SDR family oxidoreductase [Coxiellaceae bacterium]MDF1865533.1 SDR family oxidoreductase [Saprospiraceae bacterium]
MVNISYDLQETSALITGGAGFLGRQHANALLECGASVILADINNVELKRAEKSLAKYGSRLNTVHMDITSEDSIRVVNGLYKNINVLINNAAIDPKVDSESMSIEKSRVENFSLDQWDLELNVGLRGAFLCSKVFGGSMAENTGGVILNIASDLSVIAPDQRLYKKEGLPEASQPVKPVTYSVIKAGLIGLTRYLASYWADKNIRVNALSPGGIFINQPESFVEKITDLIPMGRMAVAGEYKEAVQFMCSKGARYMTGQNIVIDGGRSII